MRSSVITASVGFPLREGGSILLVQPRPSMATLLDLMRSSVIAASTRFPLREGSSIRQVQPRPSMAALLK